MHDNVAQPDGADMDRDSKTNSGHRAAVSALQLISELDSLEPRYRPLPRILKQIHDQVLSAGPGLTKLTAYLEVLSREDADKTFTIINKRQLKKDLDEVLEIYDRNLVNITQCVVFVFRDKETPTAWTAWQRYARFERDLDEYLKAIQTYSEHSRQALEFLESCVSTLPAALSNLLTVLDQFQASS